MAPHVAMVTGRRLATNSCSHAYIFFLFFLFALHFIDSFAYHLSSALFFSPHPPRFLPLSLVTPISLLSVFLYSPSIGSVKAILKWDSRKAPDRLKAGPGGA